MIKFEDGSTMEAEDWNRIMAVVKQRAKEKKSPPTEIKQGTVTVVVKGFEPKANAKQNAPAHANFVEGHYKGWKIRVWRIEKDQVYGCNYFMGEDVRYMEVPYPNVKDENGVFKYVQGYIDEI